VSAVNTLEYSRFSHFYRPSFDSEGHAFDQNLGYLLPGRRGNPPQRLPRHPHPFGGLFLMETLIIGQPQGLVFVHREFDRLQCPSGDARRLEEGEIRQ